MYLVRPVLPACANEYNDCQQIWGGSWSCCVANASCADFVRRLTVPGHVHTEREGIYAGPLGTDIIDTNLWVRHTTAVP